MLRLKEVASQSETFPKRALEKQRVMQMIEWMAHPATTGLCFLLTGRLYWLLCRLLLIVTSGVADDFPRLDATLNKPLSNARQFATQLS
jgi:hypothetical protein